MAAAEKMESLAAGKSVLAWPMFAEQHLNARHVANILGVGVRVDAKQEDGEGIVGRAVVEAKVRELMDVDGKDGKRTREKAAWVQQGANTYAPSSSFQRQEMEASSSAPAPCVNGCGFFGSPSTLNLCSVCFAHSYQQAKELEDMNSEKTAISSKLDHVRLELQKLEDERKEATLERERREQELSEINKTIDALSEQREKLQEQRELLHSDREEIIKRIQQLNGLEGLKIESENRQLSTDEDHTGREEDAREGGVGAAGSQGSGECRKNFDLGVGQATGGAAKDVLLHVSQPINK